MPDRRGLVKGPQDLSHPPLYENWSTAARSLDADDNGKIIASTSGSGQTFTILNDTLVELPVGATVEFIQRGAGTLTIAAGASVTLQKAGAFAATAKAQHARIGITKVDANVWNLWGNIPVA